MGNLDKNPQNGLQGTSYMYQMGTSPNTRTAVSQKVRMLTPAYGDNRALHQMGVLATFNPTESKTIDPVKGIGFGDIIAELVPTPTEPMTGSFERALMYLCNLWQATGYAAGVDGPVRSLRHHRWPFDIEQQLVFSTLADVDLKAANRGVNGEAGTFAGGVRSIEYPQVTQDYGQAGGIGGGGSGSDSRSPIGGERGHSAIITIYEACWFSQWNTTFSKDSGVIMENGDVSITDVHDFASVYGEFLATGNDPTIGQLGSIRFQETLNLLGGGQGRDLRSGAFGGGLGGGGTTQVNIPQQ